MEGSPGVVGVLALQGDFAAHEAALRAQGLVTRQVRRRDDLRGLAGLVLPGGESTTMLRLLDIQQLTGPLCEVLQSGIAVLATCAGMILLAREVTAPAQRSLGILDIAVARNGYGRQIHSGTVPLTGEKVPAGATGVFIRAPRVVSVGDGVEVLARRDADPALVRQGPILAASFHPELQPNHFVTHHFATTLTGTVPGQETFTHDSRPQVGNHG